MVGVGFWAEFELNRNILESFEAARNATDQLENIQNNVSTHTHLLIVTYYQTHSWMYTLIPTLTLMAQSHVHASGGSHSQ